MQYSSFLKILLALVSGAFLVLAFAPFHFSIFSLLCPAVLLLLWRSASPTLAFWEGLFFGFGFFGCGVSWVFVSIDEFGGVDAFGSGLITAGFVILLALFPALQGYCLNRFFKVRGVLYSIFAFPATWIVAELLRGWILTGFPWLTLGEAEIHLPLKGFIPVLGASGAGLVTLVISGLLPLLFNRSWRTRVISAVTILALFLMGFGLTHVHFTYPKDHAVQVTLIQGNIPQSLKWNENTLSLSLSTYQSLTEQHWDSDDIFWPESAIPLFNTEAAPYLNQLQHEAREHDTAILLGIPIQNLDSHQDYNGAMVLGEGRGVYLKRHLVPFGEYVPFSSLLGMVFEILNVPMSNFASGPEDQPLVWMHNLKVAVSICYESAYALSLQKQARHTDFIAVLSDDAWFGHSIGPWQHLEISQARALETGFYVINATNNGITAIIDPQGHITASLKPFTRAALTGSIHNMYGETPWVAYGIWPLLLILLIFLMVATLFAKEEKHDE